MSTYSLGTQNGLATREVTFDTSTSIDLRIQKDGTDNTPISSSLIISKSNSTQSPTTSNATGVITATITTTHLTNLVLSLWDQFEAHWTVTFSDSVVRRFSEVLYVAEAIIEPSLQITDITNSYYELTLANSLPQGQTNWWFMANIAFIEMRNWIDTQTTDRRIWKTRNSQAYRELHKQITLEKISRYMDSKLNGSRTWESRADYHAKQKVIQEASVLAYYALGKTTNWGDQPVTDLMTVKSPKFWTGMSSQYDWGKR